MNMKILTAYGQKGAILEDRAAGLQRFARTSSKEEITTQVEIISAIDSAFCKAGGTCLADGHRRVMATLCDGQTIIADFRVSGATTGDGHVFVGKLDRRTGMMAEDAIGFDFGEAQTAQTCELAANAAHIDGEAMVALIKSTMAKKMPKGRKLSFLKKIHL